MVIDINGKSIHYERQGRGEPILFVHGWGGTINSLRNLSELAAKKYEVIILDLPGFGQSDNPDQEWGVEEYSKCVITFIQKLNLQHLTYVGHSFGGGLGIYISSHNQGIIERLILCNSAFKRSNKKSSTIHFLKNNVYKYIPFLHIFESKLKYLVYRVFFPQSDLVKYPHLEPNFRKIMTQDLTPFAKDITIPTLILWGEEDTYTPVSFAHELHASISNSQMKIYPQRRHNWPLTYPEEVWNEIKQFLK